jgi:hypothetical protein
MSNQEIDEILQGKGTHKQLLNSMTTEAIKNALQHSKAHAKGIEREKNPIAKDLPANAGSDDGSHSAGIAAPRNELDHPEQPLSSASPADQHAEKANAPEVHDQPKLSSSQVNALSFREDSDAWASQYLGDQYEPGPMTLEEYVRQLEGTAWGNRYLAWLVGNNFAQQDCLTDTWVGKDRTMFLDLTAGPFHWGPVVGGEGVRTMQSLPRVDAFASHHQSEEYIATHGAGDLTEPEVIERQESDFVEPQYNMDNIEAELFATEDYISRHCQSKADRRQNKKQCKRLKARETELQDLLDELLATKGQNGAERKKVLRHMQSFQRKSAFSFFNNGIEKGHDFNLEADHFMSQLSASLSRMLRHVVTPSVADVGGSYADRVTFHVYILSNHHSFDSQKEIHLMPFLRSALDQLRMPLQEFVFATHKLSMAADPVLTTAYANALKSAVVPSLRLDGSFRAVKRMYLDTNVLTHELKKTHVQKRIHHRHAHKDSLGRGSNKAHKPVLLDIPIFLFSLEYNLPVFVDKYYQSKATDDMIIAAQSSQHLWESHLQCNHEPIYWNLRDPVRSIVASAALILGGLVPAHVTHSDAHNRTIQNWMWSIGTNPLAHTSTGAYFSTLHRDVVQRNYIVNGIRECTHVVNTAIDQLAQQPTTIGNEILNIIKAKTAAEKEKLRSSLLRNTDHSKLLLVRRYYTRLRLLFQNVWDRVDELDFVRALHNVRTMRVYAQKIHQLAVSLVHQSKQLQCAANPVVNSLDLSYYLASAVVLLMAVLYRLLTRPVAKPKIN